MLGTHILAEFYDCDSELLNDPDRLLRIVTAAVRESGATILHTFSHQFEPQGVSGVVVISESHLAYHTWPELGSIMLDYFTCGSRVSPTVTIDILRRDLAPQQTNLFTVLRGAR